MVLSTAYLLIGIETHYALVFLLAGLELGFNYWCKLCRSYITERTIQHNTGQAFSGNAIDLKYL